MVLTCCSRFLKYKLKVVLNTEKKVRKKKKCHEKIGTYHGFNLIDIGEGITFTVTDTNLLTSRMYP